MNKLLYPKLAWQNLTKNGRFYFPYLLTIIVTAASFYILCALTFAQDLPLTNRYAYLETFLGFGDIIIAIFAIIFLFYTNSFLMKRRKKELGLYNVLGMGKRHISYVLFYETLYTAFFGIVGGIAMGMLFQKAVTALLCRLLSFDAPFGFYISKSGIIITAILFGAILFVNLLVNLLKIGRQNPIELMRESSSGEREPKTKWLLAIIGILLLGGGYAIAVTAKTAIDAFANYFVAVILVILGTYCLFTAVSITVLKILRANKKLYYKTNNFIGISGMLYRMKKNAVGLANICILSTMVLVMVSGTLSLFLGTEDAISSRYPADVIVTVQYDPSVENSFNRESTGKQILSYISEAGRTISNFTTQAKLEFACARDKSLFSLDRSGINSFGISQLCFLTAKDYTALTGEVLSLASDEVLVQKSDRLGSELSIDFKTKLYPDGETLTYKVAGYSESKIFIKYKAQSISDDYYVIVSDEAELLRLFELQQKSYNGDESMVSCAYYVDIDGEASDKIACREYISDKLETDLQNTAVFGNYEHYLTTSRAENEGDFYDTNAGFFFLGLFLGFLFIMATVLIIYYKQITEGYEDRERFRIMRQVGLDDGEIKRSINSQVLVVFFAPLLVAAVHIAFDFRLVALLLTLFGLFNTTLTLWCTLGTLALFILIYGIVYILTAKVYYRIVS